MRLVLTEAADVEALEAFGWYEHARPGLGATFRDELDATFLRVRQAPLAFRTVYRDLRRVLVHRFPYLVLYRVMDGVVVVVGIIHARRTPASWHSR